MRPSSPTPQRLQPTCPFQILPAYRAYPRNNPGFLICVVSTYNDIPGKIFTSFAKFQGIVSVKDFRLLIWLQELLQAPLCFLKSFCFARIRLDPLSGQVLHHDCISVIVSRFAIVTEDLVICGYQVTKIFCTRYGSANASSARVPCIF